MSYIQLPYGYVNKQNQIKFNLPSNYEESFYLHKSPYLKTKNAAVENNLINLIKNRDDCCWRQVTIALKYKRI